MRILLIGGTGFVSGRFLRFALDAGHRVIAVTRGSKPLLDHPKVEHITADRDKDDLVALVGERQYDAVADIICRTPEHAEQAIALARHCKRLVMVSTDYVYDPEHRKLFLKESEAVFSERADYGGDKRRAERVILAAQAAGTVEATILRPPHIYGPGSNPGTIPRHGRRPHLLDDIAAGKTLTLLQDGLGLIQPIHADDMAGIALEVIGRAQSHGQDYTCSGPELMTHLDYYREIAKVLGTTIKPVETYCPEENAPDVNHYVGGHRCYDMAKLNALLPDFAYTPFARGIAEWVRHLRQTA